MNQLEEYHYILNVIDTCILLYKPNIVINDDNSNITIGYYLFGEIHNDDDYSDDNRIYDKPFTINICMFYDEKEEEFVINNISNILEIFGVSSKQDTELPIHYVSRIKGCWFNLIVSKNNAKINVSLLTTKLLYTDTNSQHIIKKLIYYYIKHKSKQSYSNIKLIETASNILNDIFNIKDIYNICLEYLIG